MNAVLVAVAGAAGALTRYGIGLAVGTRSLPWATLAVNVIGSLLLGLLLGGGLERDWTETVTVPLGVGFLGAYTTFSTFSYETVGLVRTDRPAAAAGYVALSVLGGLAAAAAGYAGARSVA